MTDKSPITATPAAISEALINQSNSLVGQDAGLQQGLCLVAAGLFAIAAVTQDVTKDSGHD